MSKPAPGHKVFPYLLRGLSTARPNQVWAADITYVPILGSRAAGFFYLVAIMNWASRAVLAWRLPNTMDASFCLQRRPKTRPTNLRRLASSVSSRSFCLTKGDG